ncbi:MAG: hypothetical protein RIC14_01895 [Filomicrobium sp.]
MFHRTGLKLIVAGVVVLGLAGCREYDENRPLWHKPGEYTGLQDEKLNDAQREALRERARLQFD